MRATRVLLGALGAAVVVLGLFSLVACDGMTGGPRPHPTAPNVLVYPGGRLVPAPGYQWVVPPDIDPHGQDMRVVPIDPAASGPAFGPPPGPNVQPAGPVNREGAQPHPTAPNVLLLPGGRLVPAPGYRWVVPPDIDPNGLDLRVVPIGEQAP